MRTFIGPQIVEGHALDAVPQRREYAPEASNWVDARVLAANVSEAHAIPVGARYVNFAADGHFYAKIVTDTGTIAVPASDLIDGSAPALDPGTRSIPGSANFILLVAAQATVVTLEFWG